MNWQTGLEAITEADVPLGPMTYYRLGGPARWLARPQSVDQLREIVTRAVPVRTTS